MDLEEVLVSNIIHGFVVIDKILFLKEKLPILRHSGEPSLQAADHDMPAVVCFVLF